MISTRSLVPNFAHRIIPVGPCILALLFCCCLLSPLLIELPSTWSLPVLWLPKLHLTIHCYYDMLTWIMLSVVSFISLIIYSYTTRYLYADTNQARFKFQLICLMLSVMLLIVSGGLFTAFIAWQFIGLSLYLLLNHYHYDLKANQAAKKKFMINRVGDICFLLAVILALTHYGSTQYAVLFHSTQAITPVIAVLIIIAIMTKSAQFPFHIWLIDTMEAPTPVSALMHAGVINSGGFLLARLSPIYHEFNGLLFLIFLIGLSTALLGSYFIHYQADIKKRLAYSTMGQMGYMLMQCGVGCFISAVFHLIAHGFFKATLFLSSGSRLTQANLATVTAISTSTSTSILTNYKKLIINLFSLILTLGLILIAIHYTRGMMNLHPIVWFFIAITMLQLFRSVFKPEYTIIIKLLLLLITVVLFALYIFLLSHFNQLLFSAVVEQSNFNHTWLNITVISAVVIIIGFLLYQRYCQRHAMSFGFYKAGIEPLFRNYLINPIRAFGDQLILHLNQLPKLIKYSILSLLGSYLFILCGLNYYAELQLISISFLHNISLLTIHIILLLFILVMANRVKTLAQLLAYLIIYSALMILITFGLNEQSMNTIASFQLLNYLLIIIGFAVLLAKRSNPQQLSSALVRNRLPWCHFYMSVMLMLLIGIPGSASFISELYLFMGLLPISISLVILFSIAMLLLALVVLHSLQVHFFNPKAIKQHAIVMTPFLHLFCLVIIGFNLINGLHPTPLLTFIASMSIGG